MSMQKCHRAPITWLAMMFIIAGAMIPEQAAAGFRHGVNITRLFDHPLGHNGVYETPAFAPWNNEISQAELNRLRQAGYDWIRLPVDPAPFLASSESARTADIDELLNFLKVAVKSGFSVDVDLHPNPNNRNWSPSAILDAPDGPHFTHYESFASELAGRLQNRFPRRLTLELMNEPQAPCVRNNGPDWTTFQKKLYAHIRMTVKDLPLVVTGGCRSSINGLANFNIGALPDHNFYVMIHFYEPFQFTHQGASWSPWTRYLAGLRYPVRIADEPKAEKATRARISHLGLTGWAYDRAWTRADSQIESYFASPYTRATVRHRFDIAARWADTMGIARSRILVGEFGVMDEGGSLGTSPNALASRDAWLHDVSSIADSLGFGWAVWGYNGEFGIVSDNSARILDPGINTALFGK